MTFASATSIASIILCMAVMVQSLRLMRALEAVKGGGLGQIVGSVDAATAEARRVLGRLTELLRGDLAMTARTLQEGKAMVDELTVMTGIADAIAERIMAAAGASNRAVAADEGAGAAVSEEELGALAAELPAVALRPQPVRKAARRAGTIAAGESAGRAVPLLVQAVAPAVEVAPPAAEVAPPAAQAALPDAKPAPKRVAAPDRQARVMRGDLPAGTVVAEKRAMSRTSRRLRARIEADRAMANDGVDSGVAA